MIDVMRTLEILGKPIRDKITGLKGVASSISFDLYGCVSVIINPGLDKEGKLQDCTWFDVNRIEVCGEKRVMALPDFIVETGPERKPARY